MSESFTRGGLSKKWFRFRPTPQLPHGWDAGVFFEETQRTLFCSDLFHQNGDVEPLTESDIVERARQALIEYQGGFLMDYMPFTPKTERLLKEVATLQPQTLPQCTDRPLLVTALAPRARNRANQSPQA